MNPFFNDVNAANDAERRDLFLEDEKRKAQECLETLLLEGLSGEETLLTKADWQAIRQEAVTQLQGRKTPD